MSRMLAALQQLQSDERLMDPTGPPPQDLLGETASASSRPVRVRGNGPYQRILRKICSQRDLQQGGVLLFTSVERAGHTAAIAARLAALFSSQDQGDVLLVDANFVAKELTRGFRFDDASGLGETLSGSGEWQDVLMSGAGPSSFFLPAGRVHPPCHATAQARLAYALDQWADRFHFVLIDSGRVADPFTCTLSRLCSGVYLAVALEQTNAADASAAVRKLCQTDARLRGCVVVTPN